MGLEKAWRWKKRAWRREKGAWHSAMLTGASGNTIYSSQLYDESFHPGWESLKRCANHLYVYLTSQSITLVEFLEKFLHRFQR